MKRMIDVDIVRGAEKDFETMCKNNGIKVETISYRNAGYARYTLSAENAEDLYSFASEHLHITVTQK